MSDNLPTVNRIIALEIAETATVGHPGLSAEERRLLEDALEYGLDTAVAGTEARLAHVEAVMQGLEVAASKAIVDEGRLVHVEKQTQGLAEAVIAITETAVTLAPAVKAVKDEMTEPPPLPGFLKSF